MARACACLAGGLGFESRLRHTKTYADIGELLTTPVSVGLSKDGSSIHMTQSQEQHNNTPYKCLTRWKWISVHSHQMSLAHLLPNGLQWKKVSFYKLHMTHLYDMILSYQPLSRKWRLNYNEINK